jgi:hypothetical protein
VKQKLHKLIIFNRIMAALHFIQGLAIVAISSQFSLPVITSYVRFEESTQTLELANRTLFDLQFAPLIAAFFFISAAFHLYLGTVGSRWYTENLKQGINKARWYEYSVSASIMMVAIAMLAGVYELSLLIAIFALTSVMNLTGLIMEVHNQTTKRTNWLSYWIGCFAGIIPWIIVAIYFWGAASASAGGPNTIPAFVYWIYGSIFLFFNAFAINMVLQYKQIGKWKDYLYGERSYIVLSLVAKSLLAWQVFGGTLQP